MRVGIYPGSFDPITLGHLDIIKRASRLVDTLYVPVLINSTKKTLFTMDERVELIKRATRGIENIVVDSFDGLLVEYAASKKANVIFRGLRAVTDFEYELQIAQTNHKLEPNIDTVFLTTSIDYSYVSSSVVREIASYGGEIGQFVPECIVEDVLNKAKGGKR